MQKFLTFSIILLYLAMLPIFGQEIGVTVKGKVVDIDNQPLDMINVSILGTGIGVVTNKKGEFILPSVTGKFIVLIFSSVGYEKVEREVDLSKNQAILQVMNTGLHKIEEIVVEGRVVHNNTVAIQPKLTERLPTMSGGVETLIKTLPGVGNNNEMSSQYSVRGGNFDENLVYVNGIEIIRPFLVKSGEHEGLSFINSDMVSSIAFSAGGFDASYGDKMSSVLDITYRKPLANSASAEIGALGAAAHFEGSALKGKFSHITGIRYKNTSYLLGTLDKKGEYAPSFFDAQTYLNFQATPQLSFSFLGNYSGNSFQFVPMTQSTRFGTLTNPYEFFVYFEGRERDKFENRLGALSVDYHPNNRLFLKLQASTFYSLEKESYDILGQYYLSDISLGSQSNPDSSLLIGVGSYLVHARNILSARVSGFEHSGAYTSKQHQIRWGIKYLNEQISDRVNEWEMRDSAGYSLPAQPGELKLYRSVSGDNQLTSNRFSGYLLDNWATELGSGELTVTFGARAQYWDYNKQAILNPRISGSWKNGPTGNTLIRAAWGVYQQMPFFKELKNRDAKIMPGTKAQKAVHYLVGYDHNFISDGRPFRFTAEVWYKTLRSLVPYQIDNLNIRYIPEQKAIGYATGIDFKLYGEFVPGLQSWASLSLMKTEEDIIGDFYYKDPSNLGSEKIYPGYIPRPTDQRINFSLFFQDFFPSYPSVKMSMTLFYGSRLPFGPPQGERYMDLFRMPPYRRVDVGFSKILVDSGKLPTKGANSFGVKDAWIGFELFNMFDIDNTVSYYWISDIKNVMYAVPNYLTGRRVNLKLSVRF